MAAWTRRKLIDKAIANLGVLVQGQAPSDEMVQKVDNVVDPMMISLRTREVINVANYGTPGPPAGGEIEEELVLPLADCLAWAAAPEFSLAGDPSLKVLNTQAEDLLRVLARPSRSRRMLRVDHATRTYTGTGRGSFSRGT